MEHKRISELFIPKRKDKVVTVSAVKEKPATFFYVKRVADLLFVD